MSEASPQDLCARGALEAAVAHGGGTIVGRKPEAEGVHMRDSHGARWPAEEATVRSAAQTSDATSAAAKAAAMSHMSWSDIFSVGASGVRARARLETTLSVRADD